MTPGSRYILMFRVPTHPFSQEWEPPNKKKTQTDHECKVVFQQVLLPLNTTNQIVQTTPPPKRTRQITYLHNLLQLRVKKFYSQNHSVITTGFHDGEYIYKKKHEKIKHDDKILTDVTVPKHRFDSCLGTDQLCLPMVKNAMHLRRLMQRNGLSKGVKAEI